MAITLYEWLGAIMRSPAVRVVMDQTAEQLESRLRAINAQYGGSQLAGTVTRYDGTRPKGRPYDQVGLSAVHTKTARQELAEASGDPNAAVAARLAVTVRSPTA